MISAKLKMRPTLTRVGAAVGVFGSMKVKCNSMAWGDGWRRAASSRNRPSRTSGHHPRVAISKDATRPASQLTSSPRLA